MSENKSDNDKQFDGVKREDYNKVVESHNTIKAELEKAKEELGKMKQQHKTEEEKKEWQTALEEQNKIIEDLKNKINEKKDEKGVLKGKVVEPNTQSQNPAETEAMKKIREMIPNPPQDPKNFASNLARMIHYKSPVTKVYNDEQIGMILSLHAGAVRTNPNMVAQDARKRDNDIIFRKPE